MSVVGFDIGNDSCKVAIARRGGIDMAVNEVSSRQTASIVSFNGHERFVGESAVTQVISNTSNTVCNLLRVIGQDINSQSVQEEMENSSVKIIASNKNTVLYQVQYEDETRSFRPERLMGMLLANLRKTAENELGSKVVDCVLTVPIHFKVEQRQAMIDAAQIVGLKPLCLINNTTAAALQWGFYRTPEEGQVVCFVDCGHSSFDVSVVRFGKDKFQVLGTSSSTRLASVRLDHIIAHHLARIFKDNFKVDALSRPRPKVRVFQAAEKAKRVLSANPSTPVNIECLMDDTDVRAEIDRETFESISAEVLAEIKPCFAEALSRASVAPTDVTSVELVGGSSYIPMVAKAVSEAFNGMQVSRTLNASEAIAKGACLQCALLSLSLRVREYEIKDICPFGVEAVWMGQDSIQRKTIFPVGSSPDRLMLVFYRDQPFEIELKYAGTDQLISRCRVSGMKDQAARKAELEERMKTEKIVNLPNPLPPNTIKVTFELTRSFTVLIESAVVHEEYDVEVPVKKAKTEPAKDSKEAGKDAQETEAKNGEQPPQPSTADTDATMASESTEQEKPAEPEYKVTTKKRKTTINVEVVTTVGMTAPELQSESDLEWKMIAKDREIKMTRDARNALESYVYDFRDKISANYSQLYAYIAPDQRESLLKQLSDTEEWLYTDEGENGTLALYSEKLAVLRSIGDPVDLRYRESEGRGQAFATVAQAVESHRVLAQSTEEKFSHITQEDRDKCLAKCAEVEQLTEAKRLELEAQNKAEPVKYTCDNITSVIQDLDTYCNAIMYKAKPKPVPKEEKKEEGEKMDTSAEAKPTEQQAEPKPSEQPQASGSSQPAGDMDLD
eukprot:c13205_g1_i2.p1 GENE.c13205_g1_i2~~c13205_g1_i2.p1  ORF type:complete len:842 (+),score=240.92 c13205_g1_i2:72-2597(+)